MNNTLASIVLRPSGKNCIWNMIDILVWMRMKILDNLLKGRKMQKAQVWHFGPSLGTEQPGGAIMRLTFWEQPKLFYSHLIFSEQGLGSSDMILCSKSNTSPLTTKLNVYSTFPSLNWKHNKCYKFIYFYVSNELHKPLVIYWLLSQTYRFWWICPKFLIFGPFFARAIYLPPPITEYLSSFH